MSVESYHFQMSDHSDKTIKSDTHKIESSYFPPSLVAGRLDIASGIGMWLISTEQETIINDTPASFLWIFLGDRLEEIADCGF